MQLAQVRLVGVGPITDLAFPFADEVAGARKMTVVVGGGGTGKTSLLSAIASTRPGLAVAPSKPRGGGSRARACGPYVVADWLLGEDDPARPHALRVASPNAPAESTASPPLGARPEEEREDDPALRRREQALFERRATEGGFAFIAFSGARWFSRTPVLLSSPERTVARYDVRAASSFDDPTRADLTRETKNTLAYAAIAMALARGATAHPDGTSIAERFERAIRQAVAPLARASGFSFVGVDPLTLEPLFAAEPGGGLATFDELPTGARHMVAFGALTARVVFAAHPEREGIASDGEGVALIDDADAHQDPIAQRALVPALREALPAVQWILGSSQAAIALSCTPSEVLALRRLPDADEVKLYEGEQALVH